MNISFSRFSESFKNVCNIAPLQILLLILVFFGWLDLIRERNLLWLDEKRTSSLLLFLFCLWGSIAWITARHKSDLINRSSTLLKRIWTWGILLCLIATWYIFSPQPSMSQWISLWIIWWAWILSLVGISLIWTKREDSSVHHRLLDLIEQAVISGFSVIVSSWGLSLALLAINSLFWVEIDSRRYPTVRFSCAIFLGCISFLEWVISWKLERTEISVPKWKKLFAGIVWWLLLVFWGILYVYMGKILITWQRPSNEVTFRALRYSWLVIVASLVLLPVRQGVNDKMYTLRRWLFISILPMCVMIFFAIKLRVEQYWITVERYLVIAFCIRLTVVSLRLFFRPRWKIWWLFISLMGVWIWSILWWPLSAEWVAISSQKARLTSLLIETGNLESNQMTLPISNLTPEQKQDIWWIVSYLVGYHDKNLSRLDPNLNDTSTLFDLMWIEQYRWWVWFIPLWSNNNETRHIYTDRRREIDIEWYATLYRDIYVSDHQKQWDQKFPEESNAISWQLKNNTLTLSFLSGSNTLTIDLNEHASRWSELPLESPPEDELRLMYENVKLYIRSATLRRKWDQRTFEYLDFTLLVK